MPALTDTQMQAKNPIIGLCQQATFLISAAKVDQCPEDFGHEVAFAGRSNAGKSSALNTLTHASLARTSKTPGRTQLLILLTKADKLAFGAAKNTLLKVRQDIQKGWGDRVSIQLFSAPKRIGIEDAQEVLAQWMQLGEFALPDDEELDA